jgi:hemolysin D
MRGLEAPGAKHPLVRTPSLRLVPKWRGPDERQFLPAALEIIETPASPVGRSIALLIATAAATAVLWASVGQVNIITSAPGRVVPVGRSKVLQPFQAGIVQTIVVNDGEHVTAGQPLILLDPVFANADALRLKTDLHELELDRSRLEGLRAALGTANAPRLLDIPAGTTPLEAGVAFQQMQAQASDEIAKLDDIEEQIVEKQFEAGQALGAIAKIDADLPFLGQVAAMRTRLLDDKVGSKLDWLSSEEQLAETGPDLAVATAQEEAALAYVGVLKQQRAEAVAGYTERVTADLEQVDEKIDDNSQGLIKADQLVDLTVLRAPIAGTIQQLAVHTVGGVVSQGEPLLTVVPNDQNLIVEASIKNQDIGFVHTGQVAEIKIGAYDFTRFGTIKGTVMSITRDVVDQTPSQAPENDGYESGADPNGPGQGTAQNGLNTMSQEPEYVAHIALSATSIQTDQGSAAILPGMAVTADIKTGRRRIISFLLSPFAHQIDDAGKQR